MKLTDRGRTVIAVVACLPTLALLVVIVAAWLNLI